MKVIAKDTLHEQLFNESKHKNFTIGKEYFVIGIDDEYYRLINDIGDPTLIEKQIFDVIDDNIPNEWIKKYDDGEYSIYPPELSRQYLFEDYFDGNKEAIDIFNAYVRSLFNK